MGSRSDPTCPVPIHDADNGLGRVVESGRGGYVDFTDGAGLQVAGVDRTAALATAAAGVAAGYKVARGEVTLDGSNPTPIVTGLATVVAITVARKSSVSPGLDPTHFTVDYGGGGVTAGVANIYAWKPTASGDGTLIASTNNTAVVSWVAIGT
jgi:hypothetical protein